MNDVEMITYMGTDAAKWAAEFCKTARDKGYNLDEGWVLGWFANAIEAARDVGRSSFDDMAKVTLHCLITNNPCGTDTWKVGYYCQCINCQIWVNLTDSTNNAQILQNWKYRDQMSDAIEQQIRYDNATRKAGADPKTHACPHGMPCDIHG